METTIYLIKGRLNKNKFKLETISILVKETDKTYRILSDKTGLGYRSVVNKHSDLNTISSTLVINSHRNISFNCFCTEESLVEMKEKVRAKMMSSFNEINKEFCELAAKLEEGIELIER